MLPPNKRKLWEYVVKIDLFDKALLYCSGSIRRKSLYVKTIKNVEYED
jgi:hypothetical protein